MQTHETFISAVAGFVAARVSADDADKLAHIKLVYGSGPNGTRGVTFFRRWQNGQPDAVPFVEISAFGEESWIQLAGTTIHELAHVVAGHEAGHGRAWKDACARLGLRRANAAGHVYRLASFEPDLRYALATMERPRDGAPKSLASILGVQVTPKPCGAGNGSRGGKSRGPGSGSRMHKVQCGTCGYVARVSGKWLDQAGAPHCPNHGEMDRV